MTKKLNGREKTKAEKKTKNTSAESDADFLKRMMSIKDMAIKKANEDSGSYSKEMEEAKDKKDRDIDEMGKEIQERLNVNCT